MQNYNIDVNYNNMQNQHAKTSPKYATSINKKTQVVKPENKGKSTQISFRRVGTAILGGAAKINSYIGSLTENTVTQRKRQLGIIGVGLALASITNPVRAIGAGALYVANAGVQYQIKQFKENLNAEFMKDLSGGTVNTRR
jgi:hypothetical protein